MYDVIIIGGGPAGLSAAIYAARYNLKVAVFYMDFGLIATAPNVENYPGFESISGMELMKKFFNQAKKLKITLINQEVIDIKKLKKGFKVQSFDKKLHDSKTIIIASGAKHIKLNAPGEKQFLGKGVSYCAICDAPLFRNKNVCVVGWTEAAEMAASILSNFAKKVYVLAKPSKVDFAKMNKVEIITNAEVKEIKGNQFVNKVILKNKKELSVDGIFIEIGHKPSIELAKKLKVKLSKGMVKVNATQATNIKGVFAAGDITTNSNQVRQIITAAAEGCIAANSAYTCITGKVRKMQMSHKQ